jgi:hypothetical protein
MQANYEKVKSLRQSWRGGIMRKLVFEAYEKGSTELCVPSRRYILLYRAVYNTEGKTEGDRGVTKRFAKVLNAIDALAITEESSIYLNPDGGDLVLEDAEFDLARAAWNEYRKLLPRAGAREISDMDDFIDNATEFRP